MLDSFAAPGIGIRFVHKLSDHAVELYAIHLTDGERSFAYWRKNSAVTWLAAGPAFLRDAVSGAHVVLISGITVTIRPAEGRPTSWEALREARSRRVEIAFDPNRRPRLWQDVDEAREQVARFFRIADIALPTFRTSRICSGTKLPTFRGASRAAASGLW
jgi:2-dehydro-3-deoxygluconokinase